MQLSSFFLTFLAATAVTAKGGRGRAAAGNSTEPLSDRQQCKSLDKMQSLVDLAANATRLAEKTDNNQTKIDAIQAKAAEASTELAALQANATLMATCAGIFAMEDTMDDCQRMQRIEQQVALAANDTKLASKFDNNQTKIDEFKAKAADKSTELTTLSSNTTLTAICSMAQTMGECKQIASLQKMVSQAANDTKLASKFDGNQTKIDKFKAKAAEAQTKLTTMQANTTLTSICGDTSSADTAGKSTTDGTSAADTTTGSSAAMRVEGASGFITVALAGIFALMFAL